MNVLFQLLGAVFNSAAGSVFNSQGSTETPPQLPENRSFDRTDDVTQRLESLTLVCMAMWELMKEQGVTEEQLARKVQELDLQDGRLDGRLKADRNQVTCLHCERVISRRHRRCLYCGGIVQHLSPFEGAT